MSLELMTIRVFLSSTFRDLNLYREKVKNALELIDLQVERMEVFCAQPDTPLQTSLSEVDRCDLFVGIYAYRYGHIPEGTGISMIEAEFNRAEEKGIPLFTFIVDPNFEWLEEYIEDEPGKTKFENLRRRIESLLTRELFTTPEDLAFKALASIAKYLLRPREADLLSLQSAAIPSVGATTHLGLGRLPFQQVDQVRKVLGMSSEEVMGNRLLGTLTKSRREKRFLIQKLYEEFMESFLDACTVELDQGTVDLDRFKLDALAIRAYGLLATAALGREKRNPGPIQITLKIDPSKMWPEWPRHEEFEQRTFSDWAKEFANYEAQAHDLELLANIKKMEHNDLVSWVDQRYPHTFAGLDRGIELLKQKGLQDQEALEEIAKGTYGNTNSGRTTVRYHLKTSQLPDGLKILLKDPDKRTKKEIKLLRDHGILSGYKMWVETVGKGLDDVIGVLGDLSDSEKTDTVLSIIGNLNLDVQSARDQQATFKVIHKELKAGKSLSLVMRKLKKEHKLSIGHAAGFEIIIPAMYESWHTKAMAAARAKDAGDFVLSIYTDYLKKRAKEEGW